MENIGSYPKPKLWIKEVTDVQRFESEAWTENLSATDTGVIQYIQEREVQEREERIRIVETGTL